MTVVQARVPIEALCLSVASGGTPSRSDRSLWDEGTIPWFKSGELNDGYLFDSEEQITPDALFRSSAKLYPANTVLMAMYGDGKTITTLGILGLEASINQAICGMVADPAVCHFRYLYYAVKHHRHELLNLVVAGAQRNLSVGTIRKFRITCFPLPLQNRIVEVLAAYDDLIENNRRRMALLDQTARQLYREWFVHLRFPGREHTPIVSGLPMGWRDSSLGDCAGLNDGDWIESKDQGGNDYRLVQISNIGVNEFVETGNFRFISEDTFRKLNCREVMLGDILIARMPKPIGRAWLVSETMSRLVTAVDVAIATPYAFVDPFFLVYALNSDSNLDRCAGLAGGATRSRLTRKQLGALPLRLPDASLQRMFRDAVEPMNRQQAVLARANEKLRAARDLLLPRLMSGELAV